MKSPDDVITMIIGWSSSDMLKIYSDIPEEEVLEEFFLSFNKEEKEGKEE